MLPLLRDYQQETVDSLRRGWGDGDTRLACVLPTGAGKTVIFSHLIKEASDKGLRSVVMVHRDELVDQAVRSIRSVAPGTPVGVVKAERDDTTAQTVVASVQTLARPSRLASMGRPDLVIVDEAHHAASDSWRAVLQGLGSFDGVPTAGFSATLQRDDGKSLGAVWERVAHHVDIIDLIRSGHLVSPRAVQIDVPGLDLSTVKSSGGDFRVGDLGTTLEDAGAAQVISAAYLEHSSGKRAIVFCPTVDIAESIYVEMLRIGVYSALITGDTPKDVRGRVYEDFRSGRTMVLVSVMVLTEGFDAPWAETAIIARPTRSPGLYVQMVGRVLRPWFGKSSALIIDLAGASSRHRLASLADLSDKVTDVLPGETLGGAAEREEKERTGVSGKVSSKVVDLFADSHSMWLKTDGGTWFVPTMDSYYFVWPGKDPETWNAGVRPVRGKGGNWLAEGVNIETAMFTVEQHLSDPASTLGTDVSSKNASWRSRKSAPSDAQIGYASSLGIRVHPGMTKAMLSDMISVHKASAIFDRKG